MRRAVYERHKAELQVELLKVQNWVKETGQRIVVLFEGRDAAGKGGTIKRFMEHLNPRGARVVALKKPSEAERGQWYFQRYVAELPTAGEIVLLDWSWYNRARVERVMGFCTPMEYLEFMRQTPELERMLVNSGIRLFKFWFSVTQEEQKRRFCPTQDGPAKTMETEPDRFGVAPKMERLHRGEGSHVLLNRHGGCALDGDQVERQEAGADQLHAALPLAPALSQQERQDRPWARPADRRLLEPCDRHGRPCPGGQALTAAGAPGGRA